MKIAIREGDIFINYADRFADEEIQSPPYNYKVIDVDEQYLNDLQHSDFELMSNAYVLSLDRRIARIEKPSIIAEKQHLEEWFNEYDRKVMEHMRCQRLGTQCHHNIDELDAEAVQKQELIQTLRSKLKIT